MSAARRRNTQAARIAVRGQRPSRASSRAQHWHAAVQHRCHCQLSQANRICEADRQSGDERTLMVKSMALWASALCAMFSLSGTNLVSLDSDAKLTRQCATVAKRHAILHTRKTETMMRYPERSRHRGSRNLSPRAWARQPIGATRLVQRERSQHAKTRQTASANQVKLCNVKSAIRPRRKPQPKGNTACCSAWKGAPMAV